MFSQSSFCFSIERRKGRERRTVEILGPALVFVRLKVGVSGKRRRPLELGDLASEVGHERVRLGGVVRRRVIPDEVQLDGERLREEGSQAVEKTARRWSWGDARQGTGCSRPSRPWKRWQTPCC